MPKMVTQLIRQLSAYIMSSGSSKSKEHITVIHLISQMTLEIWPLNKVSLFVSLDPFPGHRHTLLSPRHNVANHEGSFICHSKTP